MIAAAGCGRRGRRNGGSADRVAASAGTGHGLPVTGSRSRVGFVSDCLFCRMVAGDIPADVVHETDRVFAFRDINPQAPTHVLVIPKEHHATVGALVGADVGLLGEVVAGAHAVALQEGLVTDGGAEPGYRVVTNTGPQAGQSVPHVHFHVLGGRRMEWPPG
jgi:histidine triad (HIT) family protein